jgi:hypothetical protein
MKFSIAEVRSSLLRKSAIAVFKVVNVFIAITLLYPSFVGI